MTKRFSNPTPILDRSLDQDDSFLAELSSRALIARYDGAHEDVILDWIN